MKGGLPSGPLQGVRPLHPMSLGSLGLGPNFGERPPIAPLPPNFGERPNLNFGERSMGKPGAEYGPGGGPQQQLPPAPAGMQYIPCIVPMNQDGNAQLPPGAVPVGQVTAAQLQSGLPLGGMAGAFGQPPRPYGPGAGPAGPGPMLQNQQRPPVQPPRPSRGRSPAGRNNRQAPMPQPQPQQPGPQGNNNQGTQLFPQQKERDWNTVRERASPPRQVQPGPRPPSGNNNANTYGAMQGMAPPGPGNSGAGGMGGPGMGGPNMGGPGMPGMMPGMQGMPPMPGGGSPENGNFGPGFPPGPRPGFAPPQAEGENMFGALTQGTKEPWRPTFKERRSLSPPRRGGSDGPRGGSNGPAPRGGSVGPRGGSPGRSTFGKRPGSLERRSVERRAGSVGRAGSMERRRMGSVERRKIGTFDRNFVPHQSEWWTQPLPDGRQAQVYLVADIQGLQNAAWKLNHLSDEWTSSVDCHGVDLSAASGKLCIMEVAVRDNGGTQCYLFDIMQLGESIQILAPFLTSPGSSKIFNDAQKHATVLAHKFGIMLQGVIDAQCAVEMLENKTINNLWEFVEWCNVGPPDLKEEAQRWASSEVWAHRPLPKAAASHLVTGACALQAGSPVLWQRLVQQMGQTGPAMVANWSQYRVHMAASAGWACRQAGLWTGDTDFPEVTAAITGNAPDQPDPELDDWLAKRFGDGKTGAVRREPSTIRKLPIQVAATVMREGDSPRTASWRAAVATIDLQRQDARQRSGSPDLESWLARRTAMLGGDPEQKQSRRASSLPPVRSTARDTAVMLNESAPTHEGPFGFGLQIPAFNEYEPDKRGWAEILEDEQAKEAEEVGDLFNHVEEERKRLNAIAQQG